MHRVQIESQYGQPITLDQCGGCGGIWFDESELFRARQGEGRRIEQLDAALLRAPSEMTNGELRCPRDGSALFRFTDKHFPETIILERCPSCHGIWLNCGDFTRYQDTREVRMAPPKEIVIGDDGLQQSVAEMLAARAAPGPENVLGRLGNFLSTPLDERTLRPLASDKSQAGAESAIGTALNVIMLLLRLFVR
jgi:Zn-finger nucleic acid-binding protein